MVGPIMSRIQAQAKTCDRPVIAPRIIALARRVVLSCPPRRRSATLASCHLLPNNEIDEMVLFLLTDHPRFSA
jgi:hypothetical protein